MPTKKTKSEDMRPEYDFSKGERGKYAKRFAEGTNSVLLDPDIAKRFKNSEAVNKALRGLLEAAEAIDKTGKKKKSA